MKQFLKWKKVSCFLITLALCMIVNCRVTMAANNVAFAKHPSSLCVGQTCTMKVTGTKQSVKWKSSNTSVATINKKGVLKAKKKGTVTVSAAIGKKNLKCKIKISNHIYKKATCTETKFCTKCKTKSGKVLGHDYVEATCTEPKHCERCGEEEGESLGHKYAEATCTEAKHCERCGEEEGESLGHKYVEATCTKAKHCERCGEEEGESLGHKYVEATCTEPKHCERCGEEEGESLGHKYVEATCTEPKHCERCNEKTGESFGHDYSEATCTKPAICKRCNQTSGSSLGHKYDTSVLGEIVGTKGALQGMRYSCTRCSEKKMATGAQIPLKIRLQYHSSDGFTGENKSVLDSVYKIMDTIIKEGMSDKDKVKAMHDYLIYNANYYSGDLNNLPGWAAALQGVIEKHSGVCNSYALAFYTMAISEGIPCRFIKGTATNSTGTGGHAWNQVCIDGTWYYIDCTWDDPIGGGYENYDYYLSESLWSDHTQKSSEDLVTKNDYYWQGYYLCGQYW